MLELRPRKLVARADQLADAGQEELKLREERLRALGQRLRLDLQRVEERLDDPLRGRKAVLEDSGYALA